MLRYPLCLLIAIAVPFTVSAQSLPETAVASAVMPPPEVAALGKYIDIPTGTFTGAMGTAVPLYTLREGPLTLPVALGYHGGGTKLAELASRVGMGWSLQAGGMITRTQRGEPDESQRGYIRYAKHLGVKYDYEKELYEAGTNGLDTEPDIFSFNFNGHTGRFFFDGKSITSTRQIPEQDLRITPHYFVKSSAERRASNYFDRLAGFTVTTTDGTSYVFGSDSGSYGSAIDVVEVAGWYNHDKIPTAWHLTRIYSYDRQHTIELEYRGRQIEYETPASTTVYYGTANLDGGNSEWKAWHGPVYESPGGTEYLKHRSSIAELASMTTSSTVITFREGSERQDVKQIYGQRQPAKTLGAVEISAVDGSFCKIFELTHGYFESSSYGHTSSIHKNRELRLRLDRVRERSCSAGGEVVPPSRVYLRGGYDTRSAI